MLRTCFYQFPSEFGLPVIAALIVDERCGYVTLGHACRVDPVDAMRSAFAESAQLQMA